MKFLTASVAALALLSSQECQAFAPAVKPSLIKFTQLHAGTKITMPALSSTMKEGKVVSWLKNEGDEIEAGEAIMVVESDKADMDVEAFEDGIIAKIIVQEGEMAPVGEAVALIAADSSEVEAVLAEFNAGGSGGDATSAAAPPAAAPAATAAAAPEVPFSKIDMPALSSTMKEGKVVSWLKSEGDAISAGEAIMVVESDKADMDVEAFEDGFLAAIITQEGESGVVGAPVALIAENESDIPALQAYAATLSGAAPPAATAAPAAAAPVAASAPKAAPAATSPAKADGERLFASPLARNRAKELGVDISLVTGTGPEGRITAADVEAVASGEAKVKKPAATASTKPSWTPGAGVVAATPTARALAKKAKLDLATIKGTGEFGRVTADDVLIATGQKEPERKNVVRPGAAAVEMPSGPVAMTGMQKAVSNNMMATMNTPGFQVSRDIEMDNFDALYQTVKGKGVSVSALLAKAVALAIEKYPIINSSFSPENGGTIVYKKDINIAMAVAIEGGLITPCLKFANERSVEDLAENWKELVEKARKGGLKPDEYQSGTFSISNMGMFGVTQFGSILPNGTGGILAIGATREVIVPCKQAVLGMKKVKQMTVTLTCDHRQIYGSDAALFLKELANIMENNVGRLTQ